MPYALLDDRWARDLRWWTLAAGKQAVRDQLKATHASMMTESALYLLDGYLTHDRALDCAAGRPHLVELLCTPVLGEKPFLHRPGDECAEKNCLDSSGPWRDGMDYRLCGFLKKNPSRTEFKRDRAHKAELRDSRLRNLVYDRDAGCCRYCRSGPLRKRGMGRARDRRRALQFDRPNPDQLGSPPGQPEGSNLVTACARCNQLKGDRTPDEAGLVLLPVPTDEERKAWSERKETLFDLPADVPSGTWDGSSRTSDQPMSIATVPGGTPEPADKDNDKRRDKRRDKNTTTSPSSVDVVIPSSVDDDLGADESADEQQRQGSGLSSEVSGSGRGGRPVVVSDDPVPGQPARAPDAPDVYTKRSRGGGAHG